MYLLTDYSEEELKIMSTCFQKELELQKEMLKEADIYMVEETELQEKNRLRIMHSRISILREMNVRALTALQIVRDREKVMNQ